MSDANRLAFTAARLKVCATVAAASSIEGLTAVEREQLRAIGGLAALALHRVTGSTADGDDAERMASDLLAIARPVDRLVEAIGETAESMFPVTIDLCLFRRQLEGALSGNATYELTRAGEQVEADRYDNDEAPGSARARDAMGA